MTSFSIEVKRRNPEANQQVDIFNCVCWNDVSQIASECNSNQLVHIEGSIRNRSYENNESKRIFVTEIEVRQLTVIGQSSIDEPVEKSHEFASPSIPIIEPTESKPTTNFDFNEAINESSDEPLSEEVPF